MNWIGRFLQSIQTHKSDVDAHHAQSHHARHELGGADPMRWGIDKLLKGAGDGSDPTEVDVPAPTKEFFAPANEGTELAPSGNHLGYQIDAVDEHARVEFLIPADFSSITSAVVVAIVLATSWDPSVPMRLSVYTQYGTLDEQYFTHEEQNVTAENAEGHCTVGDFISWDISGVLSALAAGDYVGLRLLYAAGIDNEYNATYALFIGVHFKYS